MAVPIYVPNPVGGIVGIDAAKTTVESRFTTAETYASNALANADTAITALKTAGAGLSTPLHSITYTDPTATGSEWTANTPAAPVAPAAVSNPSKPPAFATPALTAAPVFTGVTFPNLSATVPTWTTPTAPTIALPVDPGAAPAIGTITIPTAPTVTLPSPPSLSAITIPSAPTITLPAYSVAVPSDPAFTPDAFDYSAGTHTPTSPWSTLLAKVLADITNGGTGLDVTVEAAIFDRAIARTVAENDRLYQETVDRFGSSGFDLPTGAMAAALQNVTNQQSRNTVETSDKIAIEQAELAQKNTQFVMEMGRNLEGMMLDHFQKSEVLVLEASKATAQASIDIYNAKIANYNSNIQKFGADVEAYKAEIQGSLAALEKFKHEIEGAKVTAQTQEVLVSLYSKQVQAEEARMGLFVSEIEGAKASMEIERLEIEGYKATVDAYQAKMVGEKLKVDLFTGQWGAEKIKAEQYKTQIDAFSSEAEAAKKEADVLKAEAETIRDHNQQLIDKYKNELGEWSIDLDSTIAKAGVDVESYKTKLGVFQSENTAENNRYIIKQKDIQARADFGIAALGHSFADLQSQGDQYVALQSLNIEAAKGTAQVNSQLAAAAMGAVNATATMSYTGHESNTESWGHSETLTEAHSYQEL